MEPDVVSVASPAWVLVVDPDPADQAALAALLSKVGFRVESVPTGEEAVAKLSERTWHAMIVERTLPGIDGFETTARARSLSRALPVVMTAHYAAALTPAQAQTLDEYLAKPLGEASTVELAIHRAVVNRAGKVAREEMSSTLSKISAELHHG